VGPVGIAFANDTSQGQPLIMLAPTPIAAWPGTTEGTTVGESSPSLTLHGWVNPRAFGSGNSGNSNGVFCYKIYNNNSWTSPFLTVGLAFYLNSATGGADGDWQGYITCNGSLVNGIVSALPFRIRLNVWTHVALTFSTAGGGRLYYNGSYTGVNLSSGGQPLDFGTHGPWEMCGETTSDTEFLNADMQDWRVDNVTRSDTYIQNYALQGLRALPLFT
jgi:hypothetical protein